MPSLALMVVSGVQIGSLFKDATTLHNFASQVQLGEQAADVVHELQAERDRTVGELAAAEAAGRSAKPRLPSSELRKQRAAVDAAVARMRKSGLEVSGGLTWRTAHDRSLRRLDGLAAARAGADGSTLPRRAAHDVYTRMVDSLLVLLAVPNPGPENASLDAARTGYLELSRIKELGSQARSRIFAVAEAGFAPGDYVEISDLRAQRLAALVRFRGAAPAWHVDRYDSVLTGRSTDSAALMEQSLINSGGRFGFSMDAAAWWISSTEHHDLIREVEQGLLANASHDAVQSSDERWRQTWLVIAGIALAMLAAVIVSVVIGRSMARSLQVLRREALQVAQTELPEVLERLSDVRGRLPEIKVNPPSVTAADEIGEVADAFAAVHSSAVSLALEQATMRRNVNTMFINLARRSQVLVERQIELLDDMEREERDPELLGNLFKLDHLAARMRRNDESLLVLAGNENARRWTAPTAVSATMLAAAAEIEKYTRVRHRSDDSWFINGHVVADIVHLLAELLENATAFSPPDTFVDMTGTVVGGRVLIEIADAGIGMSPNAVEEANALLARPQVADVAASERMGLFVVSHLAARHGVRVRLRAVEQGVVASVWLPPQVLAPSPEAESALGMVASGGRPVPPSGVEDVLAGMPPLPPMDLVFAHQQTRPSVPHRPPVDVSELALPDRTIPMAGTGHTGQGGLPQRSVLQGEIIPSTIDSPPAQPDQYPYAGKPDQRVRVAQEAMWAAGAAGGAETVGVANDALGAPRALGGRPRRSGGDRAGDSAWWSRGGTGAPATTGAAAPAPPEVPVIGGINERGLPVRVPMAQLPADEVAPSGGVAKVAAVSRDEPDPDAVGSTLSNFYGGVRRAEAEHSTEQPTVPVAPWREEQQ